MLVKNWMSKNVITVDENDFMQDAIRLLKKYGIRMRSIERSRLEKLKDKLSEKAALLYVIDQKENIREIYAEKIN